MSFPKFASTDFFISSKDSLSNELVGIFFLTTAISFAVANARGCFCASRVVCIKIAAEEIRKNTIVFFIKQLKSGQSLGNIKGNYRGSHQQDAIILSIF